MKFLRLIALLLAATGLLCATTVTGTLENGLGQPFNGRIQITWQTFVAPGGQVVVGGQQQVRVIDGILDVDLAPNIGSSPSGTSYRVVYTGNGYNASEIWEVPDTSSVDVASVRVSVAPTPVLTLNLNQLSTTGAANNYHLVYTTADGVQWAVDTGGGGSITVAESDGSPSVNPATTLQFLTGDLIVTDQGSGVVRVAVDSSIARDSELPTDTDDISEATNLYYTDARARAAISGGTNVSYVSGTGVISVPSFPYGSLTGVPSTFTPSAHTHTESDVTDLQAYLLSEANDLTAAVVWANVPNVNITEGAVTQHEAALSITESQISDLGSYLTSAYVTVEDEGTPLAQRSVLGFTGAGVSCADTAGETVCTISGGGSGGISTLNGQAGDTQTFSKVDDTNVTLTITSGTDDHEFALGWTGTLADSRVADDITLTNLTQITNRAYSDLQGIPSTFTPSAHVLDSASHTVSGQTTGQVLQALSATTFGFANLAAAQVTQHQAALSILTSQLSGTVDISAQTNLTADGQGIELTGDQLSLELNGSTLAKSASGLLVNSVAGVTGADEDDLSDNTIGDLGGVTITALATGEYLRFNGTALVDSVILDGDLPSTITRDSEVPSLEVNNLATVTWVNVPDANITASSVTQHETALEAVLDLVDLQGNLTESRISDLDHLTLAEVEANANNFTAQQDIDGVGTPLRFGGATADANFVSIVVTDPTAPRTLTIPNAASVAVQPITCGSTDKISAIGSDGLPVCSADDGGGGGLSNAYVSMTDGTTTAAASGGDTFKFRSADGLLTAAVQSNDPTHGDNLLLTINEGNFDLANIGGTLGTGQAASGFLLESELTDEADLEALIGVDVALTSQLSAYQPLDADLTALAALASTGMLARTAADTYVPRTITGDAEIVVTNGDGVAGAPTLAIAASIARDSELPTLASGTGVAVTGGPAYTAALDFSDAGTDPALGSDECRFSNEGASAGGWVCEGATANTIETRFRVTDPIGTDKVITFPDATGEVSLLGQSISDAEVDDDITLTSLTQITTRNYSDLQSIPSTFAPSAHVLDSATHTVSGQTAGQVMQALSATTFGFADLAEAQVTAHEAALTITESQISDLGSYLTAEVNNLESVAAGIQDTEIFIGTGAGTGNYAALSGDVTLANNGAVTIAANSVALTTDTTGNYVQQVADGVGIDGSVNSEGGTYTPTLDLTEVNDVTFGDNTDATLQHTFNPTGATNPVWSYTDGVANLSTGALQVGGAAVLTAEVNNLGVAVTWANVPDANITASSVTQHESALEGVLDLQDMQGAVTDGQVPDTITASNYLLLAGGTLTGQLVADNLGIEFEDSDTNPTCAAGNYNIFADLSETTLKKCINGTVSDLDTGGGSGAFTDQGAFIDHATATDAVSIGINSEIAKLGVVGNDAAQDVLLVRGAAAQSGNLIEAQTSAGTPVFEVSAAGNVIISGSLTSTSSDPFLMDVLTQSSAPGASGTANNTNAYFLRSTGLWSSHANGGSLITYQPLIVHPTDCTSVTGSHVVEGVRCFESDADTTYVYDGAAWDLLTGGASALNDLTDVTITGGSTGEVLRYNGSAWVDATLAYADLSGTPTLRYQTIDDEDTPLTQRATLNFEGAGVTCADDTDQTTCTIPGGGGGGSSGGGGATNYEEDFTAQTSVTLAGSEHLFAHAKLVVQCYDNASPKAVIIPAGVTINTTSFDVVVTFATAQTGSCSVAGGGIGANENYQESFSGVTSVTVTGAEHGFGHERLIVAAYDNASPKQLIQPASITIDPTSYAVVATFAAAQSGTLVVQGSSVDAGAATGAINWGAFANEPANCTASNDGSTYFDTTDQRLCVCVNDGTDDEWVTTDDYSHATGHCSI